MPWPILGLKKTSCQLFYFHEKVFFHNQFTSAAYEFLPRAEGSLSQRKVLRQFEVYSKFASQTVGVCVYTDDTAMARQLADSLAEQKCLNERDLAKRFAEEFASEPHRGYGGGVIDVFRKLRRQDRFSEPLQPAREQFNGTGSYGNGAAMRVHPVALGRNSKKLSFS